VSTSHAAVRRASETIQIAGHDPFLPRHTLGILAPPSAAGESSIGPVTDPEGQAAELTATAVEALPEGRLREQLAARRPLRVKLGIDPTAPDIHLGHVVVLDKLRQFQDAGHTVVLIVGDFTARVGDPSGQAVERPVLSAEEIEANAATFQEQAFKVLDRDRTEVRRNSEWLDMGTEELFALLRRFTIARLLERDDFERRMAAERPISVLELLYSVLQGYDSVAVHSDVELGGTDQKFNLLFARDVQEALGEPPQSILTMPILSGTDGVRRMSKSLGNYVGVTEPPEEVYGKLMSIPDDVMGEYRRLLLGEDEADGGERPVDVKRDLARRIVERFHGAEAVVEAERRFDRLHVEQRPPDDIEEVTLDRDGIVHLPALLADHFGLSRSEGRRLIQQGGVRVGGRVVPGEQLDLPASELDGEVVQVGKRRFRRVRVR
jgi:tyrosyl-tRNA synthetase